MSPRVYEPIGDDIGDVTIDLPLASLDPRWLDQVMARAQGTLTIVAADPWTRDMRAWQIFLRHCGPFGRTMLLTTCLAPGRSSQTKSPIVYGDPRPFMPRIWLPGTPEVTLRSRRDDWHSRRRNVHHGKGTRGSRGSWSREMADGMSVETWRDLLPRLRYKDLGADATFGHRDTAKLEGFEVARSRPSNGGPPILNYAAALLFVIGVRVSTPTWEAVKMLRDSGYGPPYGRGPWDRTIHDQAMRLAKG